MIQVFIMLDEQTVVIYTMELITAIERFEECSSVLWWLGLQGMGNICCTSYINYLRT